MTQQQPLFIEAEARVQSAAAYARFCAGKYGADAPETKAAAARALRFISVLRQVKAAA